MAETQKREIILSFLSNAKETKTDIDALLAVLDNTTDEYKELTKQSNELAEVTNELTTAYNEYGDALNLTNDELNELESKTDNSIKKTRQIQDNVKRLTSEYSNNKKALSDLGNTLSNNSTITSALDKVTGGYYSSVKDLTVGTLDLIKNTKLATTLQSLFSGAVRTSTGAVNGLKVALVSSGIGALVVVLGYAISKMMEFATSTNKTTTALENQKKALDDISRGYRTLAEDLDFAESVAMEHAKQASKTEMELGEMRKNFSQQRIKQIQDELTEIRNADLTYQRSNDFRKLSETEREQYYEDIRLKEVNFERQITILKRQELLNQQKDVTAYQARIASEQKQASNKTKAVVIDEMKTIESEVNKLEQYFKSRGSIYDKIFSIGQGKTSDDYITYLRDNLKKDFIDLYDEIDMIFDAMPESMSESLDKAIAVYEKKGNNLTKIQELQLTKLKELRKQDITDQKDIYDTLIEQTGLWYDAETNKLNKIVDLSEKFKSINFMGLDNQLMSDGLLSGNISTQLELIKKEYEELFEVDPTSALQFNKFEEMVVGKFNILKSYTSDYKSYSQAMSEEEIQFIEMNNKAILNTEQMYAIAELELLEATEKQKEYVRNSYRDKFLEEEKASAEALKRLNDIKLQSYLAFTDGVSGTLSALSDMSKEGSGIQKGLAIASIGMDAGVSAISAYKGMVATFPGYWGIAAGIASASASLLQGANQIKKVRAIKTDGTETGMGGTSMSSSIRPNVSFVSSSDNQISKTIAEATQTTNDKPIQAYVVTKDIRSGEELDRNAINNNSI